MQDKSIITAKVVTDQMIKNQEETPASIREYWERLGSGHSTGPVHLMTGSLGLWQAFDAYNEQLRQAMQTIATWYKNDGFALYITGKPGCGKTHLARAVHQAYGPGSVFYNEIDLVKRIQHGYSNKEEREESEGRILLKAKQADMLIVDDLGAYHAKSEGSLEWLRGIYYGLFDGRQEKGQSTMITSNFPLASLEARLGLRVFDRINGQIGADEFDINLVGVPSYRRRRRRLNGKQ